MNNRRRTEEGGKGGIGENMERVATLQYQGIDHSTTVSGQRSKSVVLRSNSFVDTAMGSYCSKVFSAVQLHVL